MKFYAIVANFKIDDLSCNRKEGGVGGGVELTVAVYCIIIVYFRSLWLFMITFGPYLSTFLTWQKSKKAAGIQDGGHLEKMQYVYVLWRQHVT